MKIAITGALGHIGSKALRDLPRLLPGSQYVLIDDFSTQRYCSLFNLPQGVNYRFIEADIMKADLKKFLGSCDVVIHLAAITNAAGSFEIQEQVEKVNFDGTIRVAEVCGELGIPILFLSTTSVYGTQAESVDEDCSIEELKPQSPYAASKLKAEQWLTQRGREMGLNFVTCRFGTIFGISPGMRFHTAVNKFCWQAVMGQPITVWRTALNQYRPYLDLNDGVRAMAFILQKGLYDRKIYNVNTCNSTVGEIVEQIQKHIPSLGVELVDTKIMNQLSYHVRNDRFKNLGFEFKGNIQTGISETLTLLKGMNSFV